MGGYDYDVAIVGGGSAGYAAARTAAAAGLRAVVIEGGPEVGGLCILRGCMPTKALLYAAEVKHLAQHPQAWGIEPGKVSFDFARVMARKNALIEEFATDRRAQLLDGRFQFIRALARFTDAHTLELHTGQSLSAAHFVITSGSLVAPAPLPFLDDFPCLTSDDALNLDQLPKSLIVLGGGPVGVELAQFFARFDVPVTLIQRSPHILHEFDAEAAAVIETVLRREGMTVHTGTRLTGASQKNGGKSVSFEHDGNQITVEAAEVLFALGRIPNTASLQLDRAGVQTEDGHIVTNDRMQTSAPHIYAAGDCTGPHEIVHLAVLQGEIAARNIAHPKNPRPVDYRLLINIVFTEPQLAVVGLTEKECAARGIPYLAASHPFADHGKSLIMQAKDGFVKLLASPANGEILGGCCVGPVGGELIHEIVAAMHHRMTVHQLAAMPHYHPTLAEIWTYPAEALADKIH